MFFSQVDIFCHVIDNFGDIGVVYRFVKEFSRKHPQCFIRLFCDNIESLHAIAPHIPQFDIAITIGKTSYINTHALTPESMSLFSSPDIVIEAFGCDIPSLYTETFLHNCKLWINLEYLSAEDWVESYHLKQSLVGNALVKKVFFMPGFTRNTGGVIVDLEFEASKPILNNTRISFVNYISKKAGFSLESLENKLLVSVFTYSRGFDNLLRYTRFSDREIILYVFGEKSQHGMQRTLIRLNAIQTSFGCYKLDNCSIVFMPFLPQNEYDKFLYVCDANFVRGEDSLVRAIFAEKPFLWSAYVQEEKYHQVKVNAFLQIFRHYFSDMTVFEQYSTILRRFNDSNGIEEVSTEEVYDHFFSNLNKIAHSTGAMSYFMTRNCSLIDKISDFLIRS